MKKSLVKGAFVLALGTLPGVVFAQADEAQKEVDKQVAKAITDAINARVTAQVATESVTAATPSNWWVSGGQITIEQKGAGGFDFAVPAILGGFDRDVRGKALTGVSMAYSRFDETLNPSGAAGQSGIDIESQTLSVSPYFAFLLSPNYFITTKINIGFTFSETSFRSTAGGFTTTSESDTFSFNYGLGGAFNALYRPGNFVLKGAARVDWSAFSSTTDTSSETRNAGGSLIGFSSSSTSDSDSFTSYGFDAEAGVLIGSRSYLFASYQWTDTTDSDSEASTFASIGFEQKIGKTAGLGFKYGTNVGGKDTDPDVQSFFITFRMGF
jgi:hypothetical protein